MIARLIRWSIANRFLVLLATLGKLGRTENEVATHILVREVYAMYERAFHEVRIPVADQA